MKDNVDTVQKAVSKALFATPPYDAECVVRACIASLCCAITRTGYSVKDLTPLLVKEWAYWEQFPFVNTRSDPENVARHFAHWRGLYEALDKATNGVDERAVFDACLTLLMCNAQRLTMAPSDLAQRLEETQESYTAIFEQIHHVDA